MDDDETGGDDLISPTERPFRPWGASGVAQPGADRPSRASTPTSASGPDLLPGRTDRAVPAPPVPDAVVDRPTKFLPPATSYPQSPVAPGAAVPPGY
jgi:hypothetical protein